MAACRRLSGQGTVPGVSEADGVALQQSGDEMGCIIRSDCIGATDSGMGCGVGDGIDLKIVNGDSKPCAATVLPADGYVWIVGREVHGEQHCVATIVAGVSREGIHSGKDGIVVVAYHKCAIVGRLEAVIEGHH